MHETENLMLVFSFLAEYAGAKALDQIIAKIKQPAKEQDIESLAYSLLSDSLKEFCTIYNYEFDESAILQTFSFSLKRLANFKYDEELKSILETAIAEEISPEAFKKWLEIIDNHLVSNKYETLFRALQLQSMKRKQEIFVEPPWMQQNLIDNFFEIQFDEQNILRDIYSDIETTLSKECWLITRQLLTELLFNATQHGNADSFFLLIEKNQISLKDNGSPFDTHTLIQQSSTLSGGNRTLMKYTQLFPDVEITYIYDDYKNCTTLSFVEPVFNVNSLCEIKLPAERLMLRHTQSFSIRYPSSKAKYYYVDFEKNGSHFWTVSGVIGMTENLISFCTTIGSEVFLHVPNSHEFWGDEDYFAGELLECIKNMHAENKIHVVRD